MKVAVFLRDLNCGGAEKMMVEYINYLCSHTTDEVYLILSRKKGPYLSIVHPKVKLVVLNKDRSIASVLPLFFYLKKNRVDVLYSTLLNANLTAVIIGKLLNIKVIIREANTISEFKKQNSKLKDSITLRLIKYIYNLSDRCIAISENVKTDLTSFTTISADKIHVIYNPLVIVDQFSKVVLEKDVFHVGLVSRLSTQKNIPTIAKIIEAFAFKPYNVKFHFFGEGDQAYLLDEIKNKYNSSLIEMHGFELSYYSYVKEMQLFIHLPLWEGLGNSVLEVYNSGIPMILSDISSGYSELIHPNQPNIHYVKPVGQELNIVELIEKYINNEIPLNSNRDKLQLDSNQTFSKYRALAVA